MKQIPNIVSFTRILLTPLIALLIINHMTSIAFIMYVFASVTDIFDGLLARKLNVESKFGATLDELADKILVVGVLAALMVFIYRNQVWGCFFLWVNSLLIIRHVFMICLRRYCSRRNMSHVVKVMNVGKFKTFFEMIYLGYFILHIDIFQLPYLTNDFNSSISYGLLYCLSIVSFLLSYYSLFKYTKNVVSHLTISSSKG